MNQKKRLQLEQEKLVMVTMQKENKRCARGECSKTFEPVTNKQRYCSNDCWFQDNNITIQKERTNDTATQTS
jgi:hypothetical protein